MKKGTKTALTVAGVIAGVAVIGGGALGAFWLLGKKAESQGDSAVKVAALEAQAKVAQAKADEAAAKAQADAIKAQAKAADKAWWEIALVEGVKAGGEFLGSQSFF